jgi:hypothetical protein
MKEHCCCPNENYYVVYDIFVKCNLVATRWQLYNTHLHTKIHRTQNKQYIEQHKNFENNTKILEECGQCSDLAGYILSFVLHLRKSTENPQSE